MCSGVHAKEVLQSSPAELYYADARGLPALRAQQELILESFPTHHRVRLVSQLAAYSVLLRYLDFKSGSGLRLNYPGRGNFWHAKTDMIFVEPSLLLTSSSGAIRLVLAIEVARRRLQLPDGDALNPMKGLLLYSLFMPKLFELLNETSPVFQFDSQGAKDYVRDFQQQLGTCFSPLPGQPLRFASFLSALLGRWNTRHPGYSSMTLDVDLMELDPVLEHIYPLVSHYWQNTAVNEVSSVYRAGTEVVNSVWPQLSCLIEQDGKALARTDVREFLSRFGLRQMGHASWESQPLHTCARVLLCQRTGSDSYPFNGSAS